MKNLITTVLLTTSLFFTNAVAEETHMYIGLDLISSDNTVTKKVGTIETDTDNDSDGFKLKFGSVLNDGWRLQGYYLNETYDKPVIDGKHDTLNEIGLDLIKGFEVTPKFSPFIQAGIGYGWMDIHGYNKNSINSFSVKLGTGVMYKITTNFELLAGLDLQVRGWEDISFLTTTIKTSESSSKLYIGANVHF